MPVIAEIRDSSLHNSMKIQRRSQKLPDKQ